MNKVKIVRENFKFLIDKGFVFYKYKDNIEECFVFSSENKDIVLTYDVRLNTIDIGLLIKEGKNIHKDYISLLEANISTKDQREKLLIDIESIYFSARNDWIISKKHFNQLVNLYAKFVKQNLIEIQSIGQSSQLWDD